jgi:hypothetical protein
MATYDNRTYESWRVKCDDRHRREPPRESWRPVGLSQATTVET